MFVIGTAGHVDHGKSTLVKALTGIDPDRLREEKEREMTIELGFAWLKLPSGREVSVVDVPGHERFIKNMLAGVGGIDAALLVIDADEGPMPQTEEHLHILDLLQVRNGLVVLTKRDLVDGEWLALVQEDVRERLKNTTLANAPMLAVSARNGEGLAELKAAIDVLLDKTTERTDKGRPRLGIDRVFSVAGFGTVVTGTLMDGSLALGQEIEILPGGLRGRIRGLQSHKHKLENVGPGQRVAVNLSGVATEDLTRGQVLTLPGLFQATVKLDAHLQLLPDAPKPLAQNALLDLFVGASETSCRVTLLDAEKLEPGKQGWVQLRLAAPVVIAKNDRFILRQPSPSITIGGGVIVEPLARRHRRFAPDILSRLATLERGTPGELIQQTLGVEALDVKTTLERTGLDPALARETLLELLASGDALTLGASSDGSLQNNQLIMSLAGWNTLTTKLRQLLQQYHAANPLRRGMSKEELKSRLGLPPRVYSAAMTRAVANGVVAEEATAYRLPDHTVEFSGASAEQLAKTRAAFAAAPYLPPSPFDLGLDAELVNAFVDQGILVKITPDIYYERETYNQMVARILALIDERGGATVGDMRDLFDTSRKYAVPFMEHLDETRVTRRKGDTRIRW